ncbi:MAG: hypothetical protein KDI98_09740 [Hyphomicrobiaceae bacterium]|nr:hypothetical protein [Hyphomicrobiaceae bacterium]
MSRQRVISGVRILKRLLMCTLGYFIAVFAAGVFMTLALAFEKSQSGTTGDQAILVVAILIALFAAGIAFLPAVCLIVLTEIMALRSALVHGLGGVAVAALAGLVDRIQFAGTAAPSEPSSYLALYLGAGAIGGLVYWAVAGRAAGAIYERDYSALSGPASEEA